MTTEQFEKLVEVALADVPERFRQALENITIEVDPSQMIHDSHHHLILGHYIGIPLPNRGTTYRNAIPDKIIIYQRAFAHYPQDQLPALVKNVLLHEIGHYFGMSEEELGPYKKV